MGYDHVVETSGATSATEKFNTGHTSVLDKLLADYYLGRRGEYAESNKLMRQLTKVFEDSQNTDIRNNK